jgi:hypothetical protein
MAHILLFGHPIKQSVKKKFRPLISTKKRCTMTPYYIFILHENITEETYLRRKWCYEPKILQQRQARDTNTSELQMPSFVSLNGKQTTLPFYRAMNLALFPLGK